jgi:putative salt-induced outer membrane protein
MVSKILKSAVPAVLLAMPAVSLADDAPAAPAPPPPPFVVTAQAGYVASHGNTQASTANLKFDAIFNDDAWKHEFTLQGLYGKSNDIVSAERLDAQWQSNYNITDRLYAFGSLHYDDDKFSGFQYQETAAAGLGYSIFKQADATLDAQAGIGYRRFRPEVIVKDPASGDVISRTPEDAQSGAVATVTVKGMYAFNASTKLIDTLAMETGKGDTLLQNDIGIQVAMSSALSLIAGYEIKHNSSPPPPLGKSDSLITFNVAYQLK